MCGLCKREIKDYNEDTAQCHRDCFADFLISFNIPTEEIAEKIEHIVELKPEENSILHFRLGTELIPASRPAIEEFRKEIEKVFDGSILILITSTLVDVKVVRPE